MTMRTTTTILALSVLLLAAAPATAQMSTGKGITDAIEGKKAEAPPCVGPDCPVELAPAPKAPATGWKRWTNFIDRELDAVGKADLYGVTSQMPKGYASIKWDYVQI
jgi:hypothetical protein